MPSSTPQLWIPGPLEARWAPFRLLWLSFWAPWVSRVPSVRWSTSRMEGLKPRWSRLARRTKESLRAQSHSISRRWSRRWLLDCQGSLQAYEGTHLAGCLRLLPNHDDRSALGSRRLQSDWLRGLGRRLARALRKCRLPWVPTFDAGSRWKRWVMWIQGVAH